MQIIMHIYKHGKNKHYKQVTWEDVFSFLEVQLKRLMNDDLQTYVVLMVSKWKARLSTSLLSINWQNCKQEVLTSWNRLWFVSLTSCYLFIFVNVKVSNLKFTVLLLVNLRKTILWYIFVSMVVWPYCQCPITSLCVLMFCIYLMLHWTHFLYLINLTSFSELFDNATQTAICHRSFSLCYHDMSHYDSLLPVFSIRESFYVLNITNRCEFYSVVYIIIGING